jgi:ketosteroid isomerase-like protein
MAENIQWFMPAEGMTYDKEGIKKMFTEHPMKIVSITKDNFIVEGNSASVNGEVTCRDVKTGKEYNMYYCDVYELTDGKVSKMVSYTVEKKK